jgi:hypothetical protein
MDGVTLKKSPGYLRVHNTQKIISSGLQFKGGEKARGRNTVTGVRSGGEIPYLLMKSFPPGPD